MTILFYSDPHFGLSRKANFTRDSNSRLEIHRRWLIDNKLKSVTNSVCLGDFFDKTTNPEIVLIDSILTAEYTSFILAGNHDVPNSTRQASTLDVLGELYPDKVILPGCVPEAEAPVVKELDGVSLTFIPHQLNQSLFEKQLDKARNHTLYGNMSILCLHCNYDSPFELSEESLNLTKEWAEILLEKFDYILLGHEHKPREDFDGRLKVLGNPYPTNFSEDHDHFVYYYDPETDSWKKEKTGSEDLFWEGSSTELDHVSDDLIYNHKFYTLYNERGDAHKTAAHLLNDCEAYAVRVISEKTGEVTAQEIQTFKTLRETIEERLSDELKVIFNELLGN